MLKLIKKYRSNPKRIVVTFSFQKKMILNRLGDLMQKKELKTAYEEESSCSNACEPCAESTDCRNGDAYVLENEKTCKTGRDAYNNKRKQIELEQSQILEKDGCQRAFKENYHIKPLEYGAEEQKRLKKGPVEVEKDMRGGVVCEKSFRMLLCDLVTGVGAVIFLICLFGKLKALKNNKKHYN